MSRFEESVRVFCQLFDWIVLKNVFNSRILDRFFCRCWVCMWECPPTLGLAIFRMPFSDFIMGISNIQNRGVRWPHTPIAYLLSPLSPASE